MSELALSAADVAELVTYVAPGYVAQLGYQARFPRPPRSAGELLIVSVVSSLPLVALVNAMLPNQRPTQVGHVGLLLVGSAVLGYVVALLRDTRRARDLPQGLGYRYAPEGTIYAETLKHMKPQGTVLVELKDGRRVAGCPRSGPQLKDDGINELYLVYPEAEDERLQWSSAGEGLIVPLSEVSTITLSEEPTGAPPKALSS